MHRHRVVNSVAAFAAMVCALPLVLALALPVSAAEDAAAAPPPPPPTVITTKDGSRFVGRIQSMENGELKLQTNAVSGDTVTLKFAEITAIEAAEAHSVVLKDGSLLRGIPATDKAGRLVVQTESSGPIGVDLANVAAINPPEKKALRQKAFVSMNGKVTDGNTRTKSVTSNGEYEMRTDKSRFSVRGDWNYAEDDGELSARNASGSLKYDYFFTKKVFGYLNSVFEGDDFADLNLRTTLGAGGGCQFLDGTTDGGPVDYYEEAGLSFFDEDFDDSEDSRYAAGRISGKLDWRIIAKRIMLFHFHEMYFGFEDQDDVNADTQTGVRMTIVGSFFAVAQINYRWDNTPAPGNNRGDTEYLWGLGFSKEF